MPLTYIHKDKLNQPIFGCNNLAGEGLDGDLQLHAYQQLAV
jgi:hypothetical protein